MGKVTKINLPNGFSISCESDDAGVPDITQNAGENVMKADEEAQKPVEQEAAEYDAAAEADKDEAEMVQEVAKANESTFFGLSMMRRSQEGFGITKSFKNMKFASPKEALATPEIKMAIEEAKKWAKKKNYSLATMKEVKAKTGATSQSNDKVSISFVVVDGAVIQIIKTEKVTDMVIFFKKITAGSAMKEDYKVFAKKLAVYKNAPAKSAESVGLFSEILSKEATDAAEAETSDANTTVVEEEKAPETPAEEETTEVDVKSEAETKDETPAEEETTEVDVKSEAKEEEKKSSEDEADDDEKAIENFFANWGL